MNKESDKFYKKLVHINKNKTNSEINNELNSGKIILLLQELSDVLNLEKNNVESTLNYNYRTAENMLKTEINNIIQESDRFVKLLNCDDDIRNSYYILYRDCIKGRLIRSTDDNIANNQKKLISDLFLVLEKIYLDNYKVNERTYLNIEKRVFELKKYYGQKVTKNNVDYFCENFTLTPVIVTDKLYRLIKSEYYKNHNNKKLVY